MEAQNTGEMRWQDRVDNIASPSHLHIHVRVSFYMQPQKVLFGFISNKLEVFRDNSL